MIITLVIICAGVFILYIFEKDYIVDKHEIRRHNWKWDNGYSLGDFLYPDSVRTDSTMFVDDNNFIYYDDTLKGKVLGANSHHLTIRSNDGKIGHYVAY